MSTLSSSLIDSALYLSTAMGNSLPAIMGLSRSYKESGQWLINFNCLQSCGSTRSFMSPNSNSLLVHFLVRLLFFHSSLQTCCWKYNLNLSWISGLQVTPIHQSLKCSLSGSIYQHMKPHGRILPQLIPDCIPPP